jgi:cytochrome c oxidase subunit 2
MNVVPGMITQFSFTPTVTTDEINETEYMRDKVAYINEIRRDKSAELAALGEEPLGDYDQFEYYLLCNKICGVAHYNMQMKVVVETEEEFNTWMAEQKEYSETMEAATADTQVEENSGSELAQVEN